MTSSRPLSVTFRVDASLDIGTGHVMRCLTLADALHERGAFCRFVCRAHPGNLIELVRQRSYEALALPAERGDVPRQAPDGAPLPGHAGWLGTDWETDAHETRAILAGQDVDWLIVDHYALDAHWEHSLRPACCRIMVIDDLADRPHDCDVLLDQNLGRSASDYAALVPGGCTVLAGPQYALLRPEFAALRPYSLARRETLALRRLLITMGGVDKDNATGKVLDTLRQYPLPPDCEITVIMGPHAPWLDQVRKQASEMPWPTEVRVNITDMAQVMADSDLAIGAAGSAAWERCCLGLPTLQVVLAENQLAGGRALHNTGAALSLGEPAVLSKQLASALWPLLTGKLLVEMSRAACAVTDGQGAARVIQHMEHQV